MYKTTVRGGSQGYSGHVKCTVRHAIKVISRYDRGHTIETTKYTYKYIYRGFQLNTTYSRLLANY